MQRRLFLFGSLAAPLAQTARAQATPDQIGVGMIGVGIAAPTPCASPWKSQA